MSRADRRAFEESVRSFSSRWRPRVALTVLSCTWLLSSRATAQEDQPRESAPDSELESESAQDSKSESESESAQDSESESQDETSQSEGESESENDPPAESSPEVDGRQDETSRSEGESGSTAPDQVGGPGAQSPGWGEEEEFTSDDEGALPPDEEIESEFFDEDEDEEFEFEAVAEVSAPPREPTKRTVEQEQLTRIPGTRGDALRAVEIMPGVARTEFASNDGAPILRGSTPYESLVLIDGAQVPLIYHFGGLTSVFNSHLLESVDLYPGNFSARYGRVAGGVVEAKVRDPKTDGFHALVELSAIDSFAVVEGPATDKTSVAIAARRSNIDFFFENFVPEDAYSVLAAPVYWDYQGIVTHRFDEKNKLRFLTYGSEDTLELYFSDAAAEDPGLRGSIDGRVGFHRLQLEMESKFSETVEQNVMVSAGPMLADQQIGALSSKARFWEVNARSEWSIFASDAVRVDTGLDLWMFGGKGEYTGPAPGPDEGTPDSGSLAAERFINIEETGLTPVRPAAYVEASLRPIESLLIVPGVRADYIADGEDWTVDPRLSSRFDLTDSTTLKGGIGVYSQPPEYFQIMDDLGNPELTPFRTIQSSGGVEQKFGEHVKVDLEGFHKRYENRIVGTENNEPPNFENNGLGRAYGLEFLFNMRMTDRTQAFVSYTLSRSERQERDDPWRLFDYDQTHNLQLTANYDLGKGWLAGARFRYVTGNPINEVEGAVYDASSDTYRPLFGEINGGRNPAFHQLDVRVEKMWQLGPVGLTSFVEVLNVYNAQNEEGQSYSFDYTESEGVTGMPFFPNIGIRGQL